MKTSEISISYGGKTILISDLAKYYKNPQKCLDFSKVAAIVFIKKEIDSIKIDKDEYNVDGICQLVVTDIDRILIYVLKVICDKKIKELPDFIVDLINTTDEEEMYDLFIKFLKFCNL